jgi:hypothetical protein
LHNLQILQNDFQNYLLDKPSSIQTAIVDRQPVPALMRLAIYRDGYFLRLLEALEQDYEVLRALIGIEEFDQLGRDYIHAHPSSFRSIRWYGNEFALFLKQKTNQPSLIEMAQFEWLLAEAFDAADSAIVTEKDITAIPFEQWPHMQFILHPSLRQLELYTNTVSLWKSYKETDVILSPNYSKTPVPWIIWRKEYDIQFCSLAPSEC